MKRYILLIFASLLLTACSRKDDDIMDNSKDVQETVTVNNEVPTNASTKVSPYLLMAYIKLIDEMNPEGYVNFDTILEPLKVAKALIDDSNVTQDEINSSLDQLRTLVEQLNDGSGFVKVNKLTENSELTDPFTFFYGDKVTSPMDWEKRAEEIKNLFQYYMYGILPSGEDVTYTLSGNTISLTVEHNGKKVTFPATYSVPDKNNVPMPEGGYPVIIAFGWLQQVQYANNNGYAVITLNTQLIAEDSSPYRGAFYNLYPYGDVWTEQSGVLVAWSWGISKVIDALVVGAGSELGINPENTIVTGVSRWGKAAAVAGAFDKRIKVTAPSCSGSGGMGVLRYPTQGKVYDFSSVGASSTYTMTANEPLGSLQSSSEKHWFNTNFLEFKDKNYLPFDQHLLASIIAKEDRYLFITASYLHEDWTNPPAMWLTYLASKEVYDYLGLEDNIAIHIHKEGHMVTDEDMEYLINYCNYHFYGKESTLDLNDLKTSLFMEDANYDSIYDKYVK